MFRIIICEINKFLCISVCVSDILNPLQSWPQLRPPPPPQLIQQIWTAAPWPAYASFVTVNNETTQCQQQWGSFCKEFSAIRGGCLLFRRVPMSSWSGSSHWSCTISHSQNCFPLPANFPLFPQHYLGIIHVLETMCLLRHSIVVSSHPPPPWIRFAQLRSCTNFLKKESWIGGFL